MARPELHRTIAQGKFLRFVMRGHWEYVERVGVRGCVGMIAVTGDEKIILVEQYRPPVNHNVIELPAGLVGDSEDPHELVTAAAHRELIEETGYEADELQVLFTGVLSAGLSNETLTFVMARGVKKVSEGGGIENEKIIVHEVPLKQVHDWLQQQADIGRIIDAKVYTGLYWLGVTPPGSAK